MADPRDQRERRVSSGRAVHVEFLALESAAGDPRPVALDAQDVPLDGRGFRVRGAAGQQQERQFFHLFGIFVQP
jgi:hypothetical protein